MLQETALNLIENLVCSADTLRVLKEHSLGARYVALLPVLHLERKPFTCGAMINLIF